MTDRAIPTDKGGATETGPGGCGRERVKNDRGTRGTPGLTKDERNRG